jgi:hypothetical protein
VDSVLEGRVMSIDSKVMIRVALIRNIREFLKFRKDDYFREEIKQLIKAYRESCKL